MRRDRAGLDANEAHRWQPWRAWARRAPWNKDDIKTFLQDVQVVVEERMQRHRAKGYNLGDLAKGIKRALLELAIR